MNRIAIAFSSKDRPDLTAQTIKPLLQQDRFDLHWIDASTSIEGQRLLDEYDGEYFMAHRGVGGGSCRAIVYALSTLLESGYRLFPEAYDYIGLVENDVLLDPDWFEATMQLFERGQNDGLEVGAVSARNFEDRILIQRDGYSINHNLGAGCQIFTRKAAELILQQYRTGMTGENRRTFSVLSGIDIASYWAFRGAEHVVVADWTWDWMLAQHGLCSLALTPAKATHLEDLARMGLKIADREVEERRDQAAFERYQDALQAIRNDQFQLPASPNALQFYDNAWTIFPHQLPMIGAVYSGDWRFKWSLAYGCFAWKSGNDPTPHQRDSVNGVLIDTDKIPRVSILVLGSLNVLMSGGEKGGKVRIEDDTGFAVEPDLPPEKTSGILQCAIPGNCNYRMVRIAALTPGCIFYGIRTSEAQPVLPQVRFDFGKLPPL